MRIDRNAIMAGLSETSGVAREKITNSTQLQSRSESDVATLETASKISALEAQVRQMPEVRQEKVMALAQAVRSGQFNVSGNQIAGSMFTAVANIEPAGY